MSPAVGILSASILFCLLLAPPVHAQASGTVSIVQLPAWNSAPSGAKLCLWDPGQYDVASTLGCPSPTLNVCYCPTGDASSSVLNAITGCMTYWYSIEGILQLPTAVSVYSQYCAGAGAASTTSPTTSSTQAQTPTPTPTPTQTQTPTQTPTQTSTAAGSDGLTRPAEIGTIVGTVFGGVTVLGLIITCLHKMGFIQIPWNP